MVWHASELHGDGSYRIDWPRLPQSEFLGSWMWEFFLLQSGLARPGQIRWAFMCGIWAETVWPAHANVLGCHVTCRGSLSPTLDLEALLHDTSWNLGPARPMVVFSILCPGRPVVCFAILSNKIVDKSTFGEACRRAWGVACRGTPPGTAHGKTSAGSFAERPWGLGRLQRGWTSCQEWPGLKSVRESNSQVWMLSDKASACQAQLDM